MEDLQIQAFGEELFKKLRPYFIEMNYQLALINNFSKKQKNGFDNKHLLEQKKEMVKYYLQLIIEQIENNAEHNK